MLRIAHLSDIHISSPSMTLRKMWTGKRLLGGANMLLRRRHDYKNEFLAPIIKHVLEQNFDHVIVSGDLSTTALDAEFSFAKEQLLPLIQKEILTTIPGNHDIYTQKSEKQKRYEKYFSMCHGETQNGDAYPFVRKVGEELAIIGVNTCLATGPLQAWGQIGERQLDAIGKRLEENKGKFRILVIHHHILDRVGTPGKPVRSLKDRDALLGMLRKAGAEMILHGHDHARYDYEVEGPDGPIPVFNPAPTTRHRQDPKHQGGYQVYEIAEQKIQSIKRFNFDPQKLVCYPYSP